MKTQILSPMRSKRNLTRFTYENTAFQGWRLCLSRGGTTFTRYFSDRHYGSGRKALDAAESALTALKDLLEKARKVDGKLQPSTIRRAEKLLASR